MNEYEKWHKQKETQQHTQLFRQKYLYVKQGTARLLRSFIDFCM